MKRFKLVFAKASVLAMIAFSSQLQCRGLFQDMSHWMDMQTADISNIFQDKCETFSSICSGNSSFSSRSSNPATGEATLQTECFTMAAAPCEDAYRIEMKLSEMLEPGSLEIRADKTESGDIKLTIKGKLCQVQTNFAQGQEGGNKLANCKFLCKTNRDFSKSFNLAGTVQDKALVYDQIKIEEFASSNVYVITMPLKSTAKQLALQGKVLVQSKDAEQE